MATAHKVINKIACNSADWTNCERSTAANTPVLDKAIQNILHHPMKDTISVAWLFSYHYQKQKQTQDIYEARVIACIQVYNALNSLK